MAVTSGFFNSVSGDRMYNAEQIGNYFEGLIGNGVFENVGNKLVVVATSGLNIAVKSGRAMINCHWIKNDADLILTLDSADVQYDRLDAVVVKLNLNNGARTVSIEIKKGTPSITPTVPSLERTDTIYELCLAVITVQKGATSITQANIADRRGNTSLCGYVTGLIKQVDTNDLFLQYQTAFEEYYQSVIAQFNSFFSEKTTDFDDWFDDLTSDLRVDTTLRKYSIRTVLASNTNTLTITNENYDSDDLLLIHVNGVLLDDTEFSVTNSIVTFTNTLEAGNVVTIVGIKSVVGAGTSEEGGVPHVILTQAEYNAIQNPDANTIYIIVG